MRLINRFCLTLAIGLTSMGAKAQSLRDLNEIMFRQMQTQRGVSSAEISRIRTIFSRSSYIGQGNPAVTRHPMTPAQAAARLSGSPASTYRNARFEQICGAPYMAPLYDPATQRPEDATACVDMFEYPNIPMVYPVVWVKASEAAALCAAEGKRIGDAHEWEGASAGALLPPDYQFGLGQAGMRGWHNARYASTRNQFSIGQWRTGVCAAASHKTGGCNGGSFTGCGSNTYPAGAFPNCVSPLGVYDLDGNAAEHMNLPLAANQMASTGSDILGVTEMKGSWFIWDSVRAHEHWSRWRAPFWHGTRVLSNASHSNYHLGFRCFKSL